MFLQLAENTKKRKSNIDKFKVDNGGNYSNDKGFELINQFDGTYQVLNPKGFDISGEYETYKQAMETIANYQKGNLSANRKKVLISKYKRGANSVPEHYRTLNEDMFLAKRTKEQRKADRKERKEDRKANKGKRNPLKKVLLAPGRAAFIALLDLNIDGIATRLAKGDISKLGEQWIKLGGDRNKLIKNINKGAKKKPKKLGFLSKLVGKEGMGEDEFMLAQRYYPILNEDNDTEENPAGVSKDVKAKILAISTGVATTIGGLVGGPAGVTLGAAGPALGIVIIGVLPLLKKGADLPQAEAETPPTSEIVEPPVDVDDDKDDDADDNKTKIKKYLPYVAVGLVAVVGGYFLLKRKK